MPTFCPPSYTAKFVPFTLRDKPELLSRWSVERLLLPIFEGEHDRIIG